MSQLKFLNSNRGKAAVIFQMFFYTEKKTLNNCTVIFMCPKKNCYASIQIDEHRTMVLEIRGQHTHFQLTNSEVEKHEVSQINNYILKYYFIKYSEYTINISLFIN